MRRPVVRSLAILGVILMAVTACGGGGAGPGSQTAPGAATGAAATAVAAIAPTRATEFVIQTAPGGSSDIYARFWIGIMDKEKFVPQPVQAVNKEGGAGAVAFTYVFEKRADPHYIMVTLNSFWTTIITQKAIPYKTTDFTAIANMALDPFFLWVHADSPIKTAQEFVTEAKARAMVASGTGAKQEDEVLFRRIQDLAGTRPFTYVPQSGGGAVATALAGKQGGVEVTVNNPSEARALFQQGRLRAVCSFTPQPPSGLFQGVPTCKSQGLAIDDYYNVRAVVAPPGLSAGHQRFWIDTFRKVSEHADWKKFMTDNALDADFRAGDDFKKLIEQYQKIHEDIATKYGWIT